MTTRNGTAAYDRVWWWRKFLGDRKGQGCRLVVARSSNGNVLVEFEDGYTVVTSRWAVRKAPA